MNTELIKDCRKLESEIEGLMDAFYEKNNIVPDIKTQSISVETRLSINHIRFEVLVTLKP